MATLSNDGGALPVIFTVKKGDAVIGTYEVAGGASEVVELPLGEDEVATFEVLADDFAGVTKKIRRN